MRIRSSIYKGSEHGFTLIEIMIVIIKVIDNPQVRIEQLLKVEYAVQEEIRRLREHGIHTGLSFYPLKPEEAERLPDLFLDLTEDAVILYDEDRLLERILLELKAKLLRQGAVRVFVDQDRWYWDLRPGYKFGEIVEIH